MTDFRTPILTLPVGLKQTGVTNISDLRVCRANISARPGVSSGFGRQEGSLKEAEEFCEDSVRWLYASRLGFRTIVFPSRWTGAFWCVIGCLVALGLIIFGGMIHVWWRWMRPPCVMNCLGTSCVQPTRTGPASPISRNEWVLLTSACFHCFSFGQACFTGINQLDWIMCLEQVQWYLRAGFGGIEPLAFAEMTCFSLPIIQYCRVLSRWKTVVPFFGVELRMRWHSNLVRAQEGFGWHCPARPSWRAVSRSSRTACGWRPSS